MAEKRASSKKELHAHGCRRCRTRYMDACASRTEDDLCITCRGGLAWQLLIDHRAPHACCIAARLVTRQERDTYSLAGRSNWHICPVCKRTHPFKPTAEDISPGVQEPRT